MPGRCVADAVRGDTKRLEQRRLYVGPTGLFELWGHPGPASSTKASKDPNDARELWRISERETGIEYDCGQAFNPLSKLA